VPKFPPVPASCPTSSCATLSVCPKHRQTRGAGQSCQPAPGTRPRVVLALSVQEGSQKGSNRRWEFQLCAWFVGQRGFVLVLSTARAMEHGFSPFGRTNYENVLSAVPTIHHVIDRARIFHDPARLQGIQTARYPATAAIMAMTSTCLLILTSFIRLRGSPSGLHAERRGSLTPRRRCRT
jgi:hypothetical protein